MNHQPYREWIELGLSDELSSQEKQELETHLASCAECRTVGEEVRSLRDALAKKPRVEVTDALLMEARQEFRAALRIERSKVSVWQHVTDVVDAVFAPPMKLAAGGAFMLAVGFLGGYLMFSSEPATNGPRYAQQMSDATELNRGESLITNVNFEDADPNDDGMVAFSFDAVTPVQVKGSINDPGVQSVLVKALAHEGNPGVRMRTVSAITSPMVNIQYKKQDKEVKMVLISTMKFDENPGVRKKALLALRKFPFDDDIKQGLIAVLTDDRNQAVRIEAINSLESAKDELKSSDDKLMEILQKKIESDNNQYVRRRAMAVLREVQQ